MKLPLTGGCLCGAIRYEISAKPLRAFNCHCRTCQKSIGAAYAALFLISSENLEISGAYNEYATLAASGNTVYRGFCPKCGSTLFGRFTGMSQVRAVTAATLDDPSVFHPQADIWVTDAQPWDIMHPDLLKFQGAPVHFQSEM